MRTESLCLQTTGISTEVQGSKLIWAALAQAQYELSHLSVTPEG